MLKSAFTLGSLALLLLLLGCSSGSRTEVSPASPT